MRGIQKSKRNMWTWLCLGAFVSILGSGLFTACDRAGEQLTQQSNVDTKMIDYDPYAEGLSRHVLDAGGNGAKSRGL